VADPDPKPRKRHTASSEQWHQVREWMVDSTDKCQICVRVQWAELHHIVPRGQSGDDFPENLMPLCQGCHQGVTENKIGYLMMLRWALTPGQRFYVVERKGAGWLEMKYPAVISI
jgi:5-methylcytosine-specific restriction endonuclease McrA